MSQPEWKLIYSTDYSAVFEDKTGVYDPEMEIAQEFDEGKFLAFRFALPRLKRVRHAGTDYIVSERWDESWPHYIGDYEEWFMKNLTGVADSVGMSKKELVDALLSADVPQRAMAYESIGGYHGYSNLDQYPLELSEEELDERWSEFNRLQNPSQPPTKKLKSKLLR